MFGECNNYSLYIPGKIQTKGSKTIHLKSYEYCFSNMISVKLFLAAMLGLGSDCEGLLESDDLRRHIAPLIEQQMANMKGSGAMVSIFQDMVMGMLCRHLHEKRLLDLCLG